MSLLTSLSLVIRVVPNCTSEQAPQLKASARESATAVAYSQLSALFILSSLHYHLIAALSIVWSEGMMRLYKPILAFYVFTDG